ncbi:MAG: polyphosphate polymerase domain-containing protein [Lachnospiraceae bacterium]|nr:polyphosphate polymerase domain-containing protein [Lachnospiraceae bacterium]
MEFRHELKHEISYVEMLSLRARLKAVMDVDPHAINGEYFIRSLYFDNIYDKALREKIDGVNNREKFRIRYYNRNTERILLEKKSKLHGLCNKKQTIISQECAEAIAGSDIEKLKAIDDPLVFELYQKMRTEGLRPKVIVDYDREPYIYVPGNVRVTIDKNIRTGLKNTDYLKSDSITIPVVDSPIILEVKWDEYLPSIIRDIVQIPSTHTSAFSKYAACRMYD